MAVGALFVGRMHTIKGGREFIDALPKVVATIQRPLQVTFAGDGAQREEWEQRAAALRLREPMIDVEFTGWLQPDELSRLYSQTDLVVMPSLWPEPFGLVGSEAACTAFPSQLSPLVEFLIGYGPASTALSLVGVLQL